MAEKDNKEVWVKVKDSAGNEFICPMGALKDRKSATEQELDNCVENGVTGRFAGNINVEK